MSKKLLYFSSGIILFFCFIVFSYLVHENLFTTSDFNTTVRLQDKIPRRVDSVFSTFSDIGKFEVMTIVLIAVFAIARKFFAGFAAFTLYVTFHFIELFGKFFVSHPPPPEFLLRTERILNFPQFHVRAENSYPSGHSGRTVFLSVILVVMVLQSKRFSPLVKLILLGIIAGYNIIMLVSRVYLGEHWASDVVGGAILGAALGLISGSLIGFPFKKRVAKPV